LTNTLQIENCIELGEANEEIQNVNECTIFVEPNIRFHRLKWTFCQIVERFGSSFVNYENGRFVLINTQDVVSRGDRYLRRLKT
jgi:hypothetical protein